MNPDKSLSSEDKMVSLIYENNKQNEMQQNEMIKPHKVLPEKHSQRKQCHQIKQEIYN